MLGCSELYERRECCFNFLKFLSNRLPLSMDCMLRMIQYACTTVLPLASHQVSAVLLNHAYVHALLSWPLLSCLLAFVWIFPKPLVPYCMCWRGLSRLSTGHRLYSMIHIIQYVSYCMQDVPSPSRVLAFATRSAATTTIYIHMYEGAYVIIRRWKPVFAAMAPDHKPHHIFLRKPLFNVSRSSFSLLSVSRKDVQPGGSGKCVCKPFLSNICWQCRGLSNALREFCTVYDTAKQLGGSGPIALSSSFFLFDF